MSRNSHNLFRRPVTRRRLLEGTALGITGLAGAVLVGCGDDDDQEAPGPTATAPPTAAEATATPTTAPRARGELIVLSNSSPHVSVIDIEQQRVARTADIEGFTSWTWNDDRNWATEEELWVGLRDPDTNDVEVATLDFETLQLTNRIPIGKDELTLYIGQADSAGELHVGKMGSGAVAVIDTRRHELMTIWEGLPVNGDVVCDADISVDPQGVERFAYPTRNGDTIVTLDPASGEVLREVKVPAGSVPLMLSAGPQGNLWVQDTGSSTNSIFAPDDLRELARLPAGQNPIVASFSPDGAFAYIGHGRDTIVQVIDTETFQEVARVVAGTSPQKVAVHPDGALVYAILTQEGALALIDTQTWTLADRIMLGTNPTGIFMRRLA